MSNAHHQMQCKFTIEVDLEEAEVYMMQELRPSEMGSGSALLREFLRAWSRFWKCLGGLDSFEAE